MINHVFCMSFVEYAVGNFTEELPVATDTQGTATRGSKPTPGGTGRDDGTGPDVSPSVVEVLAVPETKMNATGMNGSL